MDFSAIIIDWYRGNKRNLPWRETTDPYKIWLSEIILQQTRVAQGLNYYHRFLNVFPTVVHLAEARQEDVMKLWQGLGYYTRARNMHEAAREIVTHHEGVFPNNYDTIRSLKGVGDYTAAAIASFAFGLPYPVIDGNVIRVITRYFGINAPFDKSEGKSQIRKLVNSVFDTNRPADFNQAAMEFGALQCIPSVPSCISCVLKEHCVALKMGMVNELPAKSSKTSVKPRYFNYLVINDGDETVIRQRGAGDIWTALYEFPLIETTALIDFSELAKHPEWKLWRGRNAWKVGSVHTGIRHVLSHRILYVTFYEIFGKTSKLPSGAIKIKQKTINNYAVPVLIEKYIKNR